ncbi:hypothetical protein [Actinopolymorpha sp. B17G11]
MRDRHPNRAIQQEERLVVTDLDAACPSKCLERLIPVREPLTRGKSQSQVDHRLSEQPRD